MSSRRIFIKQIGLGTAGIMLGPVLPVSFANLSVPHHLPRSTPEMQGVSSEALTRLFEAMDASEIEFHSIMILRNGFVIGEAWWSPYAPEYRHTLHSLSKSFTSAAVGFAIQEGHFTVETPVISFFPEMLPKEVSPNLAAMKIKHLLTMTTGHATDSNIFTNTMPWVQAFLAAPIVHEPGTFYLYNTPASYMLSAIVQKTTGSKVLDYLKPRLLDPLKIEDADWQESPQGINTGGFGLRIRTEDIASFSQLYLNKGKWKGKQLLTEEWVEASTKAQWTFAGNPFGGKTPKEKDDWQQGYGYQFWRTRNNGYRSDGLYGQFGIVLPDEQTVVAITEQSYHTQDSLNFIWDLLVPQLQKGPLRVNKEALNTMQTKESTLNLKFAASSASSPITRDILSKKILLENNPLDAKTLVFNFDKDQGEVIVTYPTGERKLFFGMNRWEKKKNGILLNSQLPFPVRSLPDVDSPVAANATWKDDNTLYLEIRPVETVTGDSITFNFEKNKVTLSFLHSAAKGGREKEIRPKIIGLIESSKS